MGSSHSHYVSDPGEFATQATDRTDKGAQKKRKAYDYVIVGGGTAGCVLASRLSEDPSVTVLLIEAGTSHEKEIFTRIPLAFPRALRTHIDWAFESIPQIRASNRSLVIPRGKVLGGSSAINALIYQRCSPEDFEQWVNLGAAGWGYSDIQPYFKKAEQFIPNPRSPGVKADTYGADGPLKVGVAPEVSPIHQVLIEACEELGVEAVGDLNTDKGPLGASTFVSITDGKGTRNSLAVAYLPPSVLERPNLTVAINTTTEKILFEEVSGHEPRAIGVQVAKSADSPKFRVRADKEVLLCGGTIGTPHVLLLSGLGPKEELVKFDIPVIKDLPCVGKNYFDHIAAGPLAIRAKPGWTYDYLTAPVSGLLALGRWLFFGSGPMAALAAPGAAFVRTDDQRHVDLFSCWLGERVDIRDNTAGPKSPDLEILWFPLITGNMITPPPLGVHGITMGAMALKPESSGELTLKTASIYDKPLINPNVFESDNDWQVVARGVRFILRLARSETMQGILDPKPHSTDQSDIFWPGDAHPDLITDDEIRAYVRDHCLPIFHPTSSARISPTLETGVVDAQLKVHGVKSLRIVDASVFPTQVSGHPAAVVVAIAEKAADLIKADLSS
ncbi:GMC oxidoreductase [Artomyces pyxidatus]|uniref:GMC oxidoreductase n=1 Tax=Artomyces pyxidatus TaxID=48021 RepID=A0ACB8TCS2_9AGAM|nr:GMC oxidoreductase [Artomyces pyxidatus]